MHRLVRYTEDSELGCYPGWIRVRIFFSWCYYNRDTEELVWDDREHCGWWYGNYHHAKT